MAKKTTSKDFSGALSDLDLSDISAETPAPSKAQVRRAEPKNMKQQRRAAAAAKLDRRKPATFTLPESLLARLKRYCLRAQLAGQEHMSQSTAVELALIAWINKYDKEHNK